MHPLLLQALMWLSLAVGGDLAAKLMQYTHCYEFAMEVPFDVVVEFADLGGDTQAETYVEAEYLAAYITYDLEELAELSDSVLRVVVVHEMVHVLSWEIGLLADEADEGRSLVLFEQMATRIERWPMWQDICQL